MLWNREYPNQLKHDQLTDLEQYLDQLTDPYHYLYTNDTDDILGWAFKFARDGEKWFAVILDSSLHKKGIGTFLLDQVKDQEKSLHGWVVEHDNYRRSDGETYPSPLNFYLKNGFKIIEEIRLESSKLSAVKITWDNQSG